MENQFGTGGEICSRETSRGPSILLFITLGPRRVSRFSSGASHRPHTRFQGLSMKACASRTKVARQWKCSQTDHRPRRDLARCQASALSTREFSRCWKKSGPRPFQGRSRDGNTTACWTTAFFGPGRSVASLLERDPYPPPFAAIESARRNQLPLIPFDWTHVFAVGVAIPLIQPVILGPRARRRVFLSSFLRLEVRTRA